MSETGIASTASIFDGFVAYARTFLLIGDFFTYAKPLAVFDISETDTKLIVGPPHHMASASVAKRSSQAELVGNGICSDAGKPCAAFG